jgi:hypothetical protein
MKRWLIGLVCFAGCAQPMIDDGDPDSPDTTLVVESASIAAGSQATVTASSLNLRSGPGTSYSIIDTMPHGATVDVLGFQSSWYQVTYNGESGWCSALYLQAVASSGGDDGGTGSTGGSGSPQVDDAINRAQSGVGFSYHWGAGCWDPNSMSYGTCSGSCPSCSHSGTWGADCSGYVAKVWQVPGAMALTSCSHPYSTYDFYNSQTHWSDISRSDVKLGDAFVHNSNGSGHIFIYDSGDAWGWLKAYEAKGCSYGIVHDTRMVTSAYKPIRREGF